MKKIINFVVVLTVLLVTQSAFSQTQRISGGPWFGCQDKDVQSQIAKIAVSGDRQAFQKIFVQAMISGACIQLKNGQAVYLEDTAIFSGLVKVRPQGETIGFWTNIEALGKK